MTKSPIYLIVGSSAASMGALSKLRALSPTATITCITAEYEMPYNRCLLADYLSGNKELATIYTKKDDFFQEHAITLIRGKKITVINPTQNTVITHDGQEYSYTKLFLGIGRTSFVPQLSGSTADNVTAFFDFNDAHRIRTLVEANPTLANIIVIGAGLSGLECADALTPYKRSITLIEKGDHVLPNQIDPQGGAFIEGLIEQNGITFYKNTTVSEISTHQGHVTSVNLSTGINLPADLVIFAIGGKPSLDLVTQTGLATSSYGLTVNEFMQTSNPDIFAGGDICAVNNLLTNTPVQSCLWSDATMQGMVAAHGMAGVKKSYPGTTIVTSSHIFGTTFVTCGPVTQAHTFDTLTKKEGAFYHRLLIDKDGILKGFIMVGNITNVGQMRRAVVEKQVIIPPAH